MKLTAKATLQINKPIHVVFKSIVDPKLLTQYFISASSGAIEIGKELIWEFADFPGKIPIKVLDVQTNKSISFVWDKETTVHITLESEIQECTIVRVTEGEKELTEKNINWLIDNTFGWGNFIDCMKAYLEYGINLRKGAFDYLKNKE